MSHDKKTFVGFGFGPIQSALFVREASRSGNFERLVVAEVLGDVVASVREAGGKYRINIAGKRRIESEEIRGLDILNPCDHSDRERIVAAVSEAGEMATCLPGVGFFDSGGAASVARLLAEGLSARKHGRPVILYAAENHNHAAEILDERVGAHFPGLKAVPYQSLNTVIGKMSGTVADPSQIEALGLKTLTPAYPGAVLVEEFNRILVSRVRLPGASRGITAFVEKDDLLPFEEAKLYGHNAVHALIGYLARLRGMRVMSEAAGDRAIMRVARDAFVKESGAALVRRYGGLGDSLFTEDGYAAYAGDLLDRMTRPTLQDLVERICRDPVRKLGYDDRLFGTMRLALDEGITPVNMAIGAAAALTAFLASRGEDGTSSAADALRRIWNRQPDGRSEQMIDLTVEAAAGLGKFTRPCRQSTS